MFKLISRKKTNFKNIFFFFCVYLTTGVSAKSIKILTLIVKVPRDDFISIIIIIVLIL